MIKRVVFYLNHIKEDVFQTARDCAEICRDYDIEPAILKDDLIEWENHFPGSNPPEAVNSPEKSDAIFVFGGDGTVLRAMDEYVDMGIPFLGINLGRLGFLPEVQTREMKAAISRVAQGDYSLEHRMMLSYSTRGESGELSGYATNEVSVSRGLSQRMIAMDVRANGTLVEHYIADGVLAASPTGSTAYSLSAGGPIISPDVDCLLVNPICPHTMVSRPLILSDRSELEINLNMKEKREGIQLSADGVTICELSVGDRVLVKRSPWDALMLRLDKNRNFYKLLKSKLLESYL